MQRFLRGRQRQALRRRIIGNYLAIPSQNAQQIAPIGATVAQALPSLRAARHHRVPLHLHPPAAVLPVGELNPPPAAAKALLIH